MVNKNIIFYRKESEFLKIGYIVKGHLYGDPWESGIFEDAEECDNQYIDIVEDSDYSDLKRYTVYIHYEEWK
jgi:hypothetical protein